MLPALFLLMLAVESHYERGMSLWREGKAGEALPHLMTALRDPEESFYASKQVALMGPYALPLLYRGLWHEDEIVRRQSAVIIGWIGETEAIDPLLLRMQHPDAPIEVEYALRKIGGLTTPKLMSLLGGALSPPAAGGGAPATHSPEVDLTNPALLDHKVASVVRLARAFKLTLDPAPLLALVGRIETELASNLEEDPHGHTANARLQMLLFLADMNVQEAATPLVAALEPGAPEANLAVARALVDLGPGSGAALEARFDGPRSDALRPLIAVTHFVATGGSEASWAGPASIWLNEAKDNLPRLRETASFAALLSREPNPLLLWFQHHEDSEVRKALAPTEVHPPAALKAFHLEKTQDPDGEVAAAHLAVTALFLPDREVESRLAAILTAVDAPTALRERAIEMVAAHGSGRLLVPVLRSSDDPLRAFAVDLAARRPESEVVSAVLAILQEKAPSDAKRKAIEVAAERWKRPEARAPLLSLLRSGDADWVEAARGLGALGAREAAEPFLGWVEAGRLADRETAASIYFALTGVAARLVGDTPGSYRFEPLSLEPRPGRGKVLVLLEDKTDYRGWVKVEESWEGKRLFRIDEARREIALYDRALFDSLSDEKNVLLLESTSRQSVLDPLELTETRHQQATLFENLPQGPLAGLSGEDLYLLRDGKLRTVPLGRELRLDRENEDWGSAILLPFKFFDRTSVRFEPTPPPSGWLRGQAQPTP